MRAVALVEQRPGGSFAMSEPTAGALDAVLDALAGRIAERAAELVVGRLQAEGWSPAQQSEEQLLDVAATAAKLAVPTSAVYKLTAAGRIPAVRVGGRLRVRSADIDRFILENMRSSQRVAELARAAQADGVPQPRRGSTRSQRPPSRRRANRTNGPSPHAAAEPSLKVLTNNEPGATDGRRSG